MMKKTLKTVCALIALLMLLSMLVACNKNKGNSEGSEEGSQAEGAGNNTSDVAETEPEILYDENGYELDTIPEGLNFGGRDFTVLAWSEWVKQDFMTAEGIVWNDELYKRQISIEQRLGVTIKVKQEAGSWNHRDSFVKLVENEMVASADCAYDLVLCYGATIGGITTNGYAANLSALEYMNLEKPWWHEDQVESCSINGKLYFVAGDATTTTAQTLCCVYGNEVELEKFGFTDLYDMVYDGKWTIEEMKRMSLYNTTETNMKGITIAASMQGPLLAGAGYKYISHDENGLVCVSPDLNNPQVHSLFATLQDVICNHENVDYNVNNATFAEGKAFFHLGQVSDMTNFAKNSTFEFIVLPMPKYDIDQEDYHCIPGSWNAYYCVPFNVKDDDCSSAVLEALGSYGHRLVVPTVLDECFSLKFVSNPEDSEMVQYIYSTLTVDAAHVFASDAVGTLHVAFHGIGEPTESWTAIYNAGIESWNQKIMILNNQCK